MKHLVKVIRKDNGGNARCIHISGLLKKDIILRRSKSFGFKSNDLVSCGALNLSKDVYFVEQKDWNKVNSLEKKHNLDSKGEINRIFYDPQNGDTLVTGVWNNVREFVGLEKIEILKAGLLNEKMPLMYVCSRFTDPCKVYECFKESKRKMVVADYFKGNLLSALEGDNNVKTIIELFSGCYS